MKIYLIKKDFTLIYTIHNLIQLLNKNSLQNKKNSVYYLYHYFDAGVVQWLVYGLAKARMPVRSRSLAPYEFTVNRKIDFFNNLCYIKYVKETCI